MGQQPKPAPQAAAKPAAAPEKKTAETAPEKPAVAQTAPAGKTTASQSDQPAWLNRIDFSSEEAGKSTVLVGTTRPVEYQITKATDKKLLLTLLDTSLPEYRKRALITTRFQSAIDRVTPTQQLKTKDTVVVFELREAVPYFVKQTDNAIRVNFSPSSIPPRPYEDAKLPAWKSVLAEPSTAPMQKSPSAAAQAIIAQADRKSVV